MISPRWRKVLRDLWRNKFRTALIVLSIAVGLLAVGTILSARLILSTGMASSYAAIRPSSGTVRTIEVFDREFVRSVRAINQLITRVKDRRALCQRACSELVSGLEYCQVRARLDGVTMGYAALTSVWATISPMPSITNATPSH
mgnify:CR=1 FL=1